MLTCGYYVHMSTNEGVGGRKVVRWNLEKDWGQERRQNRGFILKPRFENEIARPKELMTSTS